MKVQGFLLFLVFSLASANPRGVRSTCDEVLSVYDTCVLDARTAHQDALAEDDGKPDLYSRKSCNYLEQAVGTCADLLKGDCHSEDSIEAMKDHHIKAILEHLEAAEEWDSSKCPVASEYLAGLEGEEEGGEGEEGGEEGEEGAEEEGEEGAEEGGEEAEEGEEEGGEGENDTDEEPIEDGENGEEEDGAETEGEGDENGEEEDGAENGEGDEDGEDDDEEANGVLPISVSLSLIFISLSLF